MDLPRRKLDYSGFEPESSEYSELIKPYTDALADEQIDQLFESMPSTVFSKRVSFRGESGYGCNGRLFNPLDESTDYSLVDYIAEAHFGENEVDIEIKTFSGDTPQKLRIKKEPADPAYYAFTDDSFDLNVLNEDDLTRFSVRVSGSDPDALPTHTTEGDEITGARLARRSFPLTLSVFWEELAHENSGVVTSSKYLEVPLAIIDERRIYGRLLQEERERPFDLQQRLVLEHVTAFDELDAEQVTRLELIYTFNTKQQKTNIHKYTASDLKPDSVLLRISREQPNGRSEVLDISDSTYLIQFQALLNYMIETATK